MSFFFTLFAVHSVLPNKVNVWICSNAKQKSELISHNHVDKHHKQIESVITSEPHKTTTSLRTSQRLPFKIAEVILYLYSLKHYYRTLYVLFMTVLTNNYSYKVWNVSQFQSFDRLVSCRLVCGQLQKEKRCIPVSFASLSSWPHPLLTDHNEVKRSKSQLKARDNVRVLICIESLCHRYT